MHKIIQNSKNHVYSNNHLFMSNKPNEFIFLPPTIHFVCMWWIPELYRPLDEVCLPIAYSSLQWMECTLHYTGILRGWLPEKVQCHASKSVFYNRNYWGKLIWMKKGTHTFLTLFEFLFIYLFYFILFFFCPITALWHSWKWNVIQQIKHRGLSTSVPSGVVRGFMALISIIYIGQDVLCKF